MPPDTDRPSYWMPSSQTEAYPRLEQDAQADVVIVGAGIVGLTAAYLLAKAGRDVLVLERHLVAHRDSGHTTAHLTHVVDTPLKTLVETHGRDAACLVWQGNAKGMDLIERIAREEGIDCDYERVDGVAYASKPQHVARLQELHDLAHDLGFRATSFSVDAVPFHAEAALRFPNQARVHPTKYLHGLARRTRERGGRIHEDSAVEKIAPADGEPDGGAILTLANGATVRARHVIVASHFPIIPTSWTRLHPYRSYVVAARIPKASVADALFWDMEDPFHYVRLQPGDDHDVLMLGGADHPTGHEDHPEARYDRLEGMLHQALDVPFEVQWRWSAQDAGSPDHVAVVGPAPEGKAGELIATAFNGSGITYGTLAAWMLSERIQGRATEWDALFDPRRLDTPAFRQHKQHDEDRMGANDRKRKQAALDAQQLDALRPGQGGLVRVDDETIALSVDAQGRRRAVSAKCRHMGCLVRWNAAETSWDCGCHGSRYAPDGAVLDGPTSKPLEPVEAARLDAMLERLRQEAPAREGRREPTR